MSFTVPAAEPDVSPANCKIKFISWPHPSTSVPGAVKVNARSQCDREVSEMTLSVSLMGGSVRTLRETVTKTSGKSFVENEDTWVMCKNKDMRTFQGAAMGTSWEGGKPYVQFKFGAKKQWPAATDPGRAAHGRSATACLGRSRLARR